MKTEIPVYLSVNQLAAIFSVSKVTVWRWAKDGTIPAPIKLSPGVTRWRRSDIRQLRECQA